jgi:hypothetical protein
MTWCWLARVTSRPTDCLAAASLSRDGRDLGWLAAWPAGRKPVADAVRADARIIDPSGGAASISLVLLDRDKSPLFDDPAVSGALRAVLCGLPPDAVSTFVRDSSHFSGAVTVRREGRALLRDDPFRRLGPAQTLDVGPRLFGVVAPTPGPVIQRYSGAPWPVAGF